MYGYIASSYIAIFQTNVGQTTNLLTHNKIILSGITSQRIMGIVVPTLETGLCPNKVIMLFLPVVICTTSF